MILIKNSLVMDGTGKPAQRVDLLLEKNKIAKIGDLKGYKADVVIDGTGMVTAPGFIDVNTDSDHYLSLFSDPEQQDFLLQGVTTIIGGHCGSSLAPLLYGSLESVRKWANTSQININWNTVAEFLSVIEKLKLGVNFGTLIGHSTIRRAITGEGARDLTDRELTVFRRIITDAMDQGALGFSTGLGYSHGGVASFREIKILLETVAKEGGYYSTHLRDERGDIEKAMIETVEVVKQTGVKTIISHLRPIKGYEEAYKHAMHQLTSSHLPIRFDLYPFDYSILPIYTLLPDWARDGRGWEKMLEQFGEVEMKEEIIRGMPNFKSDEIVIARATGFDYLVGKTIGEFALSCNLAPKKAMLYLMEITKLKAVLFHKNVNYEKAIEAIFSDRAFISSNSPSLIDSKNVIENQRAKNTFSVFLGLLKKKGKTLEWGIERITRQPAEFLGLTKRGVITEGNIADIVILHDQKVKHVFVSGCHVVRNGLISGDRKGEVLRKKT